MNILIFRKYIIAVIFVFIAFLSFSQIDKAGLPASFSENITDDIQEIIIPKPNVNEIINANRQYDKNVYSIRIGLTVNVEINIQNSGSWTKLNNRGRIWRLKISSKGAKALGVYYDKFRIPKGGKLFLYNESKTRIIGAYTNINNPENKKFATELIYGDAIILEYYEPYAITDIPDISISEIAYIVNNADNLKYGFGDSGPCEVNINCSEGDNWQNQKKGIAKILVKKGSILSLCSGSLVNNLHRDKKPYFLTANHCGMNATAEDYDQWIFYFNYESETCPDPEEEPESNTLVGAAYKANTLNGATLGSDFKLLLLNENIPEEYDLYFNGWNANNLASASGTGIHHPYGDIKKISTYLSSVVSTQYNSLIEDPDAMYWKVVWSETQTNHGVTEGGSSGSPLFNSEGKIIGALTGGAASCQNLTGPDYYGKISYSWESNGIYDSLQLKPWLDPDNTGVLSLDGTGLDTNSLVSLFSADTSVVPVGKTIDFFDASYGEPYEWKWIFEGGEPSRSTLQNPKNIFYNSVGDFDVTLIVKNDSINDTLVRKDFINVQAVVYPNPVQPSNEAVKIFLGKNVSGNVLISVYDELGRKLKDFSYHDPQSEIYVNLSGITKGIVFLKITNNDKVDVYKLLVI